jgi:DNA-binding NarL/FixJ family response regulator
MPNPTRAAAAHYGEETQLFERHAAALRVTVVRAVRTSSANVEDACAFAWLQLLRCQSAREHAFSWLCTTAIREAVKLDRRGKRTASLEGDELPSLVDHRHDLDRRIDVLFAREAITAARLRPRESRLVGLRVCGYDRSSMAELTGESKRTVDRQLGRAQRKLAAVRLAQKEAIR